MHHRTTLSPGGALLLTLGAGAAAIALDLACAALALYGLGIRGPAILAAVFNGAGALRFAVTLLPGREPLISRYSRFDAAGLPDRGGAYTRGLTRLWAIVLAAAALAFAAAAIWVLPTGLLSLGQLLVCAAMFLGEHAVRNRRFPGRPQATPGRTLMAIWDAHRAPANA